MLGMAMQAFLIPKSSKTSSRIEIVRVFISRIEIAVGEYRIGQRRQQLDNATTIPLSSTRSGYSQRAFLRRIAKSQYREASALDLTSEIIHP